MECAAGMTYFRADKPRLQLLNMDQLSQQHLMLKWHPGCSVHLCRYWPSYVSIRLGLLDSDPQVSPCLHLLGAGITVFGFFFLYIYFVCFILLFLESGHVWRSGDNFEDSVLPFYHVGSED